MTLNLKFNILKYIIKKLLIIYRYYLFKSKKIKNLLILFKKVIFLIYQYN